MGKVMGARKLTLSFAEKCRTILSSNWQGNLRTIKADAKGREAIYNSKVKYVVRNGTPYLWVPKKDLHIVETNTDERGSFAVTSPCAGPLANLLQSFKKNMVPEVVLKGDIVTAEDEEVDILVKGIRDVIPREYEVAEDFPCTLSIIVSYSTVGCAPRTANFQSLLDMCEEYNIYRFNVSSCKYHDGPRGEHIIDLEQFEASKSDPLAPFSASIADGINQFEPMLEDLKIICSDELSRNIQDVLVLHADFRGFDILAKVSGDFTSDGSQNIKRIQDRRDFNEKIWGGASYAEFRGFDILPKISGDFPSDGSQNIEWIQYRLDFNENIEDVVSYSLKLERLEEDAHHITAERHRRRAFKYAQRRQFR